MATVFIDETRLTAIGDAIREKTGGTELLKVADMPTAIAGIVASGEVGLPERMKVLTGNCEGLFYLGNWIWIFEDYPGQVSTKDLEHCSSMFWNAKTLKTITFNFNFNNESDIFPSTYQMFEDCTELQEIEGDMVNLSPSNMADMFSNCNNLRYLPNFVNIDWSYYHNYSSGANNCFSYMWALRSVPEEFMTNFWHLGSNLLIRHNFKDCYCLDELKGVNLRFNTANNITSNQLNSSFTSLFRIKEFTFALDDDGTPLKLPLQNQTLNLSTYTGYGTSASIFTGCNSGITADKQVTDLASYEALKDDPDWFTTNYFFSRYNHDSAVNTINSLPDTKTPFYSGDLFTSTNTVRFVSRAGEGYGKSISDLTEAEIAVATDKGWTVSFVNI